jgi:hypothetical protein
MYAEGRTAVQGLKPLPGIRRAEALLPLSLTVED